jgi:Caspase domain
LKDVIVHRLLILWLAVGLVMTTVTATRHALSRLALLIGNQSYVGKIQPLTNPHNDIKTVGHALETIGFKVTSLPDAGRRQTLSAVKSLAAELAKGGPSAIGRWAPAARSASHL